MPLSDAHRLIFIHIPKNAGTSIENGFAMTATGHHPWAYYRQRFPDAWRHYLAFSVVRNPFDRLVSNYEYARLEESYWHSATDPDSAIYGKHPDYDFLRDKSFRECVLSLPHLIRHGHLGWKPQHVWISDGDRLQVDLLLHVENLGAELDQLCLLHGVAPCMLPQLNASMRTRDYRAYYDEDLIQVVHAAYGRDLELFGYDFDGPTRPQRLEPFRLDERAEHITAWVRTGNWDAALTHLQRLRAVQPSSAKSDDATPAVSVIIPCYNQAAYLREAVESVVAQTYPDWELVVVNDGSTDDSGDVAEVLAWRFSEHPIRVIHQDNQGLAAARNAGVRAARGRYILPLDADDALHPEMLARTIALLDAEPSLSIAYTDRQDFGATNRVVQAQEYDFARLRFANQLSYCSLYRRQVWEDAGGYNTAMTWGYEDWDFWIACGAQGHTGRRIPEPLFRYRVRPESMYTEALRHDDELKAQIVRNHPQVYDAATRSWSDAILAQTRPDADSPLFSVIVPTYNRPDQLHRAVASILAQTEPRFEIIVVNDAGSDVADVLQGFDDARIRYVVQETNQGPGAARNAGLEAARGQYAALLDDDDLFYPQHLETARRHLGASAPVVYTDAVRATYERRGEGYQLVEKRVPYSLDFDRNLLLVGNIAPINCFVFRIDLARQAGLFDPAFRVVEDWDFWLRLAALTPFRHVPEATVQVNWRRDGTTMTGQRQNEFAAFRARLEARYQDEIARLPDRAALLQRFRSIWAKDNQIQEPLVSIVILTHNALVDTQRCVNAILQHTTLPHELIFVDNASTDGTVAYLEQLAADHAHLRLVTNTTNRGYGQANNQGMAAARGALLVLLNNDTVVGPGWLDGLVNAAEEDPRIGLVGPLTNNASGPQYIQQTGYDPETLADFDAFARTWAARQAGRRHDFWRVVGFCVLLRREVIDRIGGFDARYGLGNFEDDDLCVRAAIAGFRAVIALDVFIHHVGGRTFDANRIDHSQALQDNWTLFKQKWGLPHQLPYLYRLNYDLSEIMNQPFDPAQHHVPLANNEPTATPSQTLLDIVAAYHASTRQQAWPDAEEHARLGTELFPHTSYPWVLLATSLRLQERTEDALDALLKALQLEETPEALFELAHLSMATDNKEEAQEAVLLLKEQYPAWTEQVLSSLQQAS